MLKYDTKILLQKNRCREYPSLCTSDVALKCECVWGNGCGGDVDGKMKKYLDVLST